MIELVLFFIGALFDWKTHRVPDYISAFLWIWIALSGTSSIAVLVFASLFFLNDFLLKVFPQPVFSWADLLVLPAYAAAFSLLPFPYIGILGFCVPILVSVIRKKEVPCLPFYFFALILATIGSVYVKSP